MFRFMHRVPVLPNLDSTLPDYHRMPAPSRLPGMDTDAIGRTPAPSLRPRAPGAQRGLAAALPGALRR